MIVITPCGSGRFKSTIHALCDRLTEAEFLVLKPPLHDMAFTDSLPVEGRLLAWKGATYAHMQRVASADVCLIVNPGGYLGVGSTLELGYAVALKKLIVALQHDAEPARDGLFNFILETDDVETAVNKLVQLFRHLERKH